MKGTLPYVYFQGNVVPAEEAKVSIATHSLQYGMTCFGGIRGFYRDDAIHVFRLADHWERLMNASRILGMEYYFPYDEFVEIVGKLIKANRFKGDIYLRPFIFSPTERLSPRIPGLSFELAVYMVELGQYFDTEKGLRLCISSWQKFSDNCLPTKAKAGGCYLNSSLATTDAVRAGYDDALVLDQDGYVVEGSVSNLIMVYHDQAYIPPLGEALLEGVTLRTMIDFLNEADIPVLREEIDRSMVYSAQELMMVGTAVQVAHVASVDGRRMGNIEDIVKGEDKGPGPVCRLLREKYEQTIKGRHPRSKEWLTEFSL